MAGAAATRVVLGIGTQVLLGWYLSEDDFGIYAVAVGFSAFLTMFKQGGVSVVLLRRSPSDIRRLAGTALLLTGVTTGLVAGLLVIARPYAVSLYDEPQVGQIMLLVALALVLDVYGLVGVTYLQAELRFADVARLEVAVTVMQYGASVLLAIAGYGPLSIALPLVVVAVTRSLAAAVLIRGSQWSYRPSVSGAREIMEEARWSIGGIAAGGLLRQADYAVLGLLVASSVVGIYYFAYQIALFVLAFLRESLRKVVIPAFGRIAGEPARRNAALLSGAQFCALFIAPLPVSLALVADSFEGLLWQGRWEAAVLPLRILSVVMAFEVFWLMVNWIIQSAGLFRTWTLQALVRGIGLTGAALVAGLVSGDRPVVITAIIGSYLIASGVGSITFLLRALDLRPSAFFVATRTGVGLAMGSALATYALATPVRGSLPAPVEMVLVLGIFACLHLAGIRLFAGRGVLAPVPNLSGIPYASTVIRALGLRQG